MTKSIVIQTSDEIYDISKSGQVQQRNIVEKGNIEIRIRTFQYDNEQQKGYFV